MTTEKRIPFALKSINTEQFATIRNAYKGEDNVSISTGFNFGVNKEENAILVVFNLSFDSQEQPFIILNISCEFDIRQDAFDSFKNKKNDTIKIPKGLLTHLAVITVGTARGILHEKLANSEFNRFILPTIDIADLIQQDLVFE